MPAANTQFKVVSIDSSFSGKGIVGALKHGDIPSERTQAMSRSMFHQGQFFKDFSQTPLRDLHQTDRADGLKTWSLTRSIDGMPHTMGFDNAEVMGSITLTPANDDQIDAKAREYKIDRSQTYIVVDGIKYFVNMNIPMHFTAPDGDNAVINLAVFVLATEGIGAAVAGIAAAMGIGIFSQVMTAINTAMFEVLWAAVWGAVQVGYAFVAAFIGQLIVGAGVEAAFAAAVAASGEVVASGVFSAITGAALAYTLVGLLVIALVFIIMSFVLHDSYQNVYIYNLTDKVLSFSIPYIYEGGAHNIGSTSIPQEDRQIGPGGIDLGSWYNGTAFRFQSDSSVHGLGYALGLSLSDPVSKSETHSFSVMFDIPFMGDNSLNVVPGRPSSMKQFYKDNEGRFKRNQVLARSNGVEVVVTYDFLSGKHNDPETGKNSYLYNSLIVVRPIP